MRPEIAACASMVDAQDAVAAAFYWHHGFLAWPAAPQVHFSPQLIQQFWLRWIVWGGGIRQSCR
ncbi:hypothetical protein [Candidatus Symbiobacter mobilis]|uniref:hypothetical protein n=1 Tax=Candidatus Symbiobacter mobilis TaxID=1436290 RepID=UPI001EE66753|nr:hypothetical protein [Candidatus Symbiobacter mobilis]